MVKSCKLTINLSLLSELYQIQETIKVYLGFQHYLLLLGDTS